MRLALIGWVVAAATALIACSDEKTAGNATRPVADAGFNAAAPAAPSAPPTPPIPPPVAPVAAQTPAPRPQRPTTLVRGEARSPSDPDRGMRFRLPPAPDPGTPALTYADALRARSEVVNRLRDALWAVSA